MNYSLSGRNNSYQNQFQEMPTFDSGISYSNQPNGKFNKTVNDMFGVGKDIFSTVQGFGEGGGSYFPFISGILGAGGKALNGGSWKDDVPQAFFGIDNKKDSDVMQTFKGAGKGAMMGTAIFPGIGTAIGALLGAGASFLDDI